MPAEYFRSERSDKFHMGREPKATAKFHRVEGDSREVRVRCLALEIKRKYNWG